MVATNNSLPVCRADLIIRPVGDEGQTVVKDPLTNSYFKLGREESFLLAQLDGVQSSDSVRAAFDRHFGTPLTEADLLEFLDLATSQRLIAPRYENAPRRLHPSRPLVRTAEILAEPVPAPQLPPAPVAPLASVAQADPAAIAVPRKSRQSLLAYRVNLFDPDRLFVRWAPRLAFLWTRGFLYSALAAIAIALIIVCLNRAELVSSFSGAMRWETGVIVWLTLVAATLAHECAHGLTCRHFGGEVREIGFLLLFLMPCFYCNVSDAWLFRERWKRIWVTLAGGLCDLCLWALAVFAWRLSAPESLINYVAFVVLSVLGVRVFLNINPLIKLDGYYLLSDVLDVSNLQSRSWGRVKEYLRWLLWGAAKPEPMSHGRLFLAYGIASWGFSIAFLTLAIGSLLRGFGRSWGVPGVLAALVLAGLLARGLLQGVVGDEFTRMLQSRRRRLAIWGLVAVALLAVLAFGIVDDKVGGSFQVRAVGRAELRAPVAGFMQWLPFDEGEHVAAGATVARLEVTDLASRIAQKHSEVGEAQARLRLLEVGPRPTEIAEQRLRVGRALDWYELSGKDLARAKQALVEELSRLDSLIAQYDAELTNARDTLARCRRLSGQAALSDQECQQAEKAFLVAQSLRAQAVAQRQAKVTVGVQEAESEVAKRSKELADAQSTLTLLLSGTRPEEIDAERARLNRLKEEARHLEHLQTKLVVTSPVAGIVTTPRLRDKVGQFVREGDLIAVVEDPGALEAEVALSEHDAARIEVGATVDLKARSMPFRTFPATVARVAPAATARPEAPGTVSTTPRGETAGTVTVYCRLSEISPELRPGTTGYARIHRGDRTIGAVYGERLLRYLRTEFWW
ncbi:MAG: HlyD family efflux transporter periplasmic adaptor subunit [Gemmataceae bacterium]|nr:HlyD family efflux transporter periplasmic adaptor subunit [Gemmataceae bacterium]